LAPTRLRSILFRAAPTIIVLGVFLLGFAGRPEDNAWLNRSHLWGPGDPFYSASDEKYVGSPSLIWRGRPGYRGTSEYELGGVVNPVELNRYGLRDDEIGRKTAGTIRILNIGDSATWGLNLQSRAETYSDQMEELLRRRAGDGPGGREAARRYEVVNGGTIGYTSLQGLQFLRRAVDDLEPDVVTVYLGNNDPAPARMKDSERILRAFPALRDALGRNFFYLLLQKGILSLRAGHAETAWDRFLGTMNTRDDAPAFRSSREYYEELARVSPDEYEASLRGIAALSKEKGFRLILLKVPENLLWPLNGQPTLDKAAAQGRYWCPVYVEGGYLARAQAGGPPGGNSLAGHPYLSLLTPERLNELAERAGESPLSRVSRLLAMKNNADLPDKDRIRATHNLGVWNLIQGKTEEGTALLETAAGWCDRCEKCPIPADVGQICYSLGIARFLSGEEAEARVILRKARTVFPFAMCPDYEERFDRVVRELGVEWIDLPSLFSDADPRFFGSALLHDWVHPSAEGNRVIAKALAERIP
jgi:lysophospholipase L1-like esterase